MNSIAAHQDELEKLLEELSRDSVVSGIGFVAFLDAYITRFDNCSEISARVDPPPAQIKPSETNYYGTNYHTKRRPVRFAAQTGETKLSSALSPTDREPQ